MEHIQKAYEKMLRDFHKEASDKLEEARNRAAKRIEVYKAKAVDINKRMIQDKKALEKAQRMFENDKRNLTKNLDAMLRAKRELDGELEEKELRLTHQHEQIKGLEDELKKAGEKSKSQAEDADKLKAEIDKLNQDKRDKDKTIGEKDEEIKKLSDEMKNLEIKMKESELETTALKGDLEKLNATRAELEKNLHESKLKQEEYIDTIEKLRDEIKALQGKADAANAGAEQIRKELEEQTDKVRFFSKIFECV